MTQRSLYRLIEGRPASDGAGVRLRRSLGQSQGARLDPFLMLDEIASDEADDYLAGFPPHPHRGFETVTYMIQGRMRHRDHLGNEGLLTDGGLQWMSTGRGIIHSEMPEQTEGRLHGFQLWINLPAAEKMKAPAYDDIPAERIPELPLEAGRVRVLAGRITLGATTAEGPVSGLSTEPLFLDLRLDAGGGVELPIPRGHNAFLYCYRGGMAIAGSRLGAGNAAVLSDGDGVTLEAEPGTGVLLLAAKPIGEPVVQYGPFVMNSSEEIEQALRDYRDGTLAGEAQRGFG